MTPDALAPTETPTRPVSADIELRVLQGPQAGCRLAIAPHQSYCLGSADECSVVLVGQHVQPEHAELQVQADMVEIRPIGGSVWVDGNELPREGELWELGSVFLVGRVALCVDEVGMPWPSEEVIAASAALALQGAAAAGELESGFGGDDMDDPDDTDEDPESMLDDDDLPDASPAPNRPDTVSGTAPPADRPALPEGAPSARPDRTLLLLVGSGLALLGAMAATAWIGSIKPPTLPDAPVAVVAAPDPIDPAPPDPTASAPLPPERVAEQLDALVRQLNVPGRISARWTLEPEGPRLRIATTDTAQSADLLARVEAMRDETGPVAVILVEPADMAARFREALQAGHLQRKFMADPADPHQLTYKASLSLEEIPAWERLFLSFTQAHGDVPPISVLVNTDLDRLGSRIGSVVGGTFPYIVTPEGHRIAPGGSLMGRTVASVQIGEIVFADGVRYRLTP
ncbi:FHA domain-containing protein [uncultured Hydrogenophaga sp.]|uniref:FHA domain-containing protein n=1 Tax=uncultured Hydrogenophaga sp. TaxID=199683 RepID=UPI00265EA366|nr:FHA domain-containing protein [uncultured Hydrogenophaga sp.]